MRSGVILTCCMVTLFSVASYAMPRPVIRFELGSDRANVFSSKSITLISPFQNTYLGRYHYDTETVFGVFLGLEAAFQQSWISQFGFSYYQNSSYVARGTVYQFSNPSFNNLTYQYQIQSRRSYLETKLSRLFQNRWRPYVTAGLGAALNKSYAYTETAVDTSGAPMSQPFASHTNHALTYFFGLGIDVDVNSHLRLGCGYRLVDLGSASLGTTPLQSHINTISHSHFHVNEFNAQISLVD